MRKELFSFDLAICSLWIIAVLGSRTAWFGGPATWIVALLVLSRILLSFTLYFGEKKSWMSGLLFVGMTAFVVCTDITAKITELTSKAFPMLGLNFDKRWFMGLTIAVGVWLWVVPLVICVINAFRKGSLTDTLTWQEAWGKLLWTDKRAKTFCLLLLITIGTLYVGLVMDARLCLFACIVAPILSLYLLNRHYDVMNGRSWILAIAMMIFFFSQSHTGLLRMMMLGISLCLVAYVCSDFYRSKKKLLLAGVSTLYLGILLPSLAIGNNQYICFNVGRTAYYTLDDCYPGIFYVADKEKGKIGLRGRYGLLVEPVYDSFAYHTPRHWFGELELRRNGYYTLYDICNNKYRVDNDIDHQLQDSLCQVVENHLTAYDYQYTDRMEVKLTYLPTPKVIAHVKALKNGSVVYDYGNAPYIPTDSIANDAGKMVCDTLVQFEFKWCRKKSLSYSHDVTINDTPVYNIQMTLARDDMPKRQEIERLTDKISKLLREHFPETGRRTNL